MRCLHPSPAWDVGRQPIHIALPAEIENLFLRHQLRRAPQSVRLRGSDRLATVDDVAQAKPPKVLVFGERHLLRTLTLYSAYYNQTRTH
jgi:hypothetical protein